MALAAFAPAALAATGVLPIVGGVIAAGLVLGVGTLAVMAISDRMQRHDVLRHNFPIVGRFTKQLDYLGKLLRNHMFASDREEKPFNRSQREAVYNYADGKLNIGSFGSTRDQRKTGTYTFPNAQFFKETKTSSVIIGPHAQQPYELTSLFNISAMSYGSISRPAVQALSRGAGASGAMLDTGEGGLAPAHLEGNADLVFEIGTAKYGVRDENGDLDPDKLKEIAAKDEVKMFSVKLAQGAKPGQGGRLPGKKVTPEIAEIRGIPVGEDSESPDHHKDINNVSELLDFIEKVKGLTGKPVGFKAVYSSQADIQAFCDEAKQRDPRMLPDFIILDGGEGGTGAAPEMLMDNVGLSIRESLPMVKETLIENGLHERIRLGASGGMILPEHVAWAVAMGADFVNSARGLLFSMGCVMAMRCNKDTCPTGLTTNNPKLQKGLDPADKGVKVANYIKGVNDGVDQIAHAAGLDDARKLRPEHVSIVGEHGRSVLMSKVYPKLTF
jgi:glutamate synthase domain-containing protein 2